MTDSRLRFGCNWDCGPKLLMLPRSDAAICFAGETLFAYPLMLQLNSIVATHTKTRSRAMDMHDFKGHAIRVFDRLRNLISDPPKGCDAPLPDATLVLAGYSWKKKDFVIWVIRFDSRQKKFLFDTVTKSPSKQRKIAIVGDYVSEFKDQLGRLLISKGKRPNGALDMEPFEVLRDMIRSGKYELVGGAPQLAKIYQHMNCTPYAVYWPSRASGQITLLGRPLLEYEIVEQMIIDPDSLEVVDSRRSVGDVALQQSVSVTRSGKVRKRKGA
jgi:hypothetical protein